MSLKDADATEEVEDNDGQSSARQFLLKTAARSLDSAFEGSPNCFRHRHCILVYCVHLLRTSGTEKKKSKKESKKDGDKTRKKSKGKKKKERSHVLRGASALVTLFFACSCCCFHVRFRLRVRFGWLLLAGGR